jgi:hypothetical protein
MSDSKAIPGLAYQGDSSYFPPPSYGSGPEVGEIDPSHDKHAAIRPQLRAHQPQPGDEYIDPASGCLSRVPYPEELEEREQKRRETERDARVNLLRELKANVPMQQAMCEATRDRLEAARAAFAKLGQLPAKPTHAQVGERRLARVALAHAESDVEAGEAAMAELERNIAAAKAAR